MFLFLELLWSGNDSTRDLFKKCNSRFLLPEFLLGTRRNLHFDFLKKCCLAPYLRKSQQLPNQEHDEFNSLSLYSKLLTSVRGCNLLHKKLLICEDMYLSTCGLVKILEISIKMTKMTSSVTCRNWLFHLMNGFSLTTSNEVGPNYLVHLNLEVLLVAWPCCSSCYWWGWLMQVQIYCRKCVVPSPKDIVKVVINTKK